jgi:hypothetical protein
MEQGENEARYDHLSDGYVTFEVRRGLQRALWPRSTTWYSVLRAGL